MNKVFCEACGSNDLVKDQNDYFVCQHCGTKYTVDAVKAMIQGSVEIVVGKEELHRILNNAKTFSELGGLENRKKSLACSHEAMDNFPSYIEAWTSYIELQLKWYSRIKSIPADKEISDIENAISSIHTISKDSTLAEEYANKMIDFWNTAAAGIINGDWILSDALKQYDGATAAKLAYALFFWKNLLQSDAFKQLIESAESNAQLVDSANYVYDPEECEWTKIKSYAPKHVRLLLPKEVIIESEDGCMRYLYVGSTTHILERVKKEIAEAKAKIKADNAKLLANKLYCKDCKKLSGVKKLFGIKCSICGRKL